MTVLRTFPRNAGKRLVAAVGRDWCAWDYAWEDRSFVIVGRAVDMRSLATFHNRATRKEGTMLMQSVRISAILHCALVSATVVVMPCRLATDASAQVIGQQERVQTGLYRVPIPHGARLQPGNPNAPNPHAIYHVRGISFRDLLAWYNRHLPVGAPHGNWEWCRVFRSEDGNFVSRIYFNPVSREVLSVDIATDAPVRSRGSASVRWRHGVFINSRGGRQACPPPLRLP
jgi:hypothetical protein